MQFKSSVFVKCFPSSVFRQAFSVKHFPPSVFRQLCSSEMFVTFETVGFSEAVGNFFSVQNCNDLGGLGFSGAFAGPLSGGRSGLEF